jgi:alkylation response protein AidB-like acyl-CoA dehydrogenase
VSSTSFTYDLDDAKFALFDQLKMHEKLGDVPLYADFDRDVYEATIEEAYKFAREVLDPINGPGDREGCHLDDEGNVTTPKGYKEAWKQMVDGGWVGPRAPVENGGAGMPSTIGCVLQEIMAGSCFAFIMYPGLGSAAARVVLGYADEAYGPQVAEKMFVGQWGGTMCLTEGGAGSSVGDNRAKAEPQEDGSFLIEGEKIFISGGDQDLTENIIHLVLARTPGSPNGTKGLSLFLVPKYDFDLETMELGERNGAHVTAIEHKMGINGSATCVLGLGVRQPCKGYLIGKERDGMRIMFHMMNEARIGVGVQGIAAAASAFQYSRHYAKERVQGTKLSDIKNADAERVAIVRHPDVRRMLMTQKVIVESLRSMCYRLAIWYDQSEAAEDENKASQLRGHVDLMVPILKAMATDLGFDVAVMGIQIFGGYGYTGDFPIEQVARDAKIQSIYEGTNGIQALDLLGRKMRIGGGKLFMTWMQDSNTVVGRGKEAGFEDQAAAIEKAIQAVGASAMHIGGVGQSGKVDAAMLYAVPFMRAFGWAAMAVECLDQALVAKRIIAESGETPLLKGKLLNLDFFVAHLLPQAIGLAKTVRSSDESCLDESLFT